MVKDIHVHVHKTQYEEILDVYIIRHNIQNYTLQIRRVNVKYVPKIVNVMRVAVTAVKLHQIELLLLTKKINLHVNAKIYIYKIIIHVNLLVVYFL